MTGSALEHRLQAGLEQVRAQNLYRTRRVIDGGHGARIRVDGRECINFCSNDYLGLAADPRIAEAARAALSHCGTGSGAAALVSGYNHEHRALEEALAEFTGRPRALLFSTGWAANLGVLRALLGKDDVLLADELNHASLIDGGRLSGAHYRRIPHADVAAFAAALAEGAGDTSPLRMIATDSVFSMDGDLAPLPQLANLVQQHGAALMIDDAHGFGVLGPRGRGAVELLTAQGAVFPDPEIYVATLGKAIGCGGAFVAGSEALIEYLIQRARSWIFSTAPPPALAAAARRGLQIIDQEPEHRRRALANLQRFRAGAAQLGIPLAASQTPIQPLIVGDAARALEMSQRLFEQGLWVAAIRPPTVPRGTSRLRITLSAAHRDEDIDRLLDALARVTDSASVPADLAASTV
ncbi:8-amino-7-oxononanoate synthase [Sinimarinibacterium sp. CAU 1509]|uniref:8-amino-7-oxononanoate synthase n=1 Tax=Sinimarinibacterium sp. CAU 1509 TaxID=2562283 RepID=UPI0010ACF038|nr:8-amino-7-oxononanoate synthase [Sinimarinibacterium sp. CAU 1509]TJY58951.1 8-amino-7-oxononanoate synthase [Sinimarinibacterium sp. CAU 1509]